MKRIVDFKVILKHFNLDPESGYNMFQGKRIELLRSYYLLSNSNRKPKYTVMKIEGLD